MSSLAEYRKMMAEKKKKHDEENPKKKEVEKSPVPLESSKFIISRIFSQIRSMETSKIKL
jgi:hypothetical protein